MDKPKKIIYLQYTNPAYYPPLEHSASIFIEKGWDVRFLGIKASRSDSIVFSDERIHLLQLPYCPPGFFQKLHYLWYCLWVLVSALIWRPRWVYVSDLLACLPGLVLKRLGFKVIYHEHDSPTPIGESKRITSPEKVARWARSRFARCAQLCVLPNEERLKIFVNENNRASDIFCVRNFPSIHEVAKPCVSKNSGYLKVFYHGSIVPERFPPTILKALLLENRVTVAIAGFETLGHFGYIRHLQDEARRLGVLKRFESIGLFLSRQKLLEQCCYYDLGLSVFTGEHSNNINMHHLSGASNKTSDYLACGLAVIVPDDPDWRRMFVEPGYGLACDVSNPEDLARVFRWYAQNPEKMRQMGESGRQRILKEWNYEAEFAKVLEQLES